MNQHVPPPNIISPQAVDVPRAQVDAIHCMIDIIDEPYTGDDLADYHLRRNKCEAARVLLQLKDADAQGNRVEGVSGSGSSSGWGWERPKTRRLVRFHHRPAR